MEFDADIRLAAITLRGWWDALGDVQIHVVGRLYSFDLDISDVVSRVL